MNLKNLKNKNIALLGFGVENYALAKFLLKNKIVSELTVIDSRDQEAIGARAIGLTKKIKFIQDKNSDLNNYDVLFRSPGYPLFEKRLVQAKKKGAVISSPMKLFLDICSTKNIIGVTGTKGKGTTSSLIYEILKKAGKKVFLGGNIGTAPFEFMNKIKKDDFIVLELSSFQLEDVEKSPNISVITNFSREHLAPADPNNPNYHKSLKSYWDAKNNIFKYQKRGDFLIINNKLKNKNILSCGNKIIYFTKSELPSQLVGEHNKENIAAAIEVAKILKINNLIIEKAVKNFHGLEHRIEFVIERDGVKYYDDSFATTPESAIIALKSFNAPIILLAGGADKGSDFKLFAKEIKKRVKFLVLFKGQGSARIQEELRKINYPTSNIKIAFNMDEAISLIKNKIKSGDIVLLSPACASFGVFKNYKERGNLFKKEVSHL